MLNKIISFSLHNRLVILISAVLLMMVGIYTAKHMDVDVFPDLNAPTVVVMTEADIQRCSLERIRLLPDSHCQCLQ